MGCTPDCCLLDDCFKVFLKFIFYEYETYFSGVAMQSLYFRKLKIATHRKSLTNKF